MVWSMFADFQIILEVQFSSKMYWCALITSCWNRFVRVQMVMASETTPILSSAIPAFKMFMSKWEQISELHPRLSRWIDVGLHWAMHYSKRMDQTNAYIMAMGECHKSIYFIFPTAISFVSLHLHDLDSSEMVTWVHPECWTADQGNSDLPPESVRSHQISIFTSLAQQYGLSDDMYFATPENTEEHIIKEEYCLYWNFASWQQFSQLTWPTFFEAALDYLPVQASAVPSKQMFLSSAKTDMKKHNWINPVMMEAL